MDVDRWKRPFICTFDRFQLLSDRSIACSKAACTADGPFRLRAVNIKVPPIQRRHARESAIKSVVDPAIEALKCPTKVRRERTSLHKTFYSFLAATNVDLRWHSSKLFDLLVRVAFRAVCKLRSLSHEPYDVSPIVMGGMHLTCSMRSSLRL